MQEYLLVEVLSCPIVYFPLYSVPHWAKIWGKTKLKFHELAIIEISNCPFD